MHRPIGILVAATVALALATAVLAAPPDKETIALTKAGNAVAAKLLVRKSDLPAGWTGKAAKPNFSGDLGCTSYRPKQSDLVVVGAAAKHWEHQADGLYAQTQVLRTPKMVKLDWQRTVVDRRVLPCIRTGMEKTGKVISFGRIAFARLAYYTAAFQAVIRVSTPAGKRTIFLETIDLGEGRDEIGFSVSGPARDEGVLGGIASQVAEELAPRLHG